MASVYPQYSLLDCKKTHQLISYLLADRLLSKLRRWHSSCLFTTLLLFVIVPKVHSLAADKVEKWLHLPTHSGLKRILFTNIVNDMRNTDTLLQEDITTITSIFSMKLKTNQFSIHKENAKRIALTLTLSRSTVSEFLNIQFMRSLLTLICVIMIWQVKTLHMW